jgi:hypothetical protein
MRARSTWSVALLLLLTVVLGRSRPARADEGARPLHERVNEAIDRGVAWLLARGKPHVVAKTDVVHWGLITGAEPYVNWTEIHHYPAGTTALALLTLLKCGVPPTHPVVQKGFAWLQVRHEATRELDSVPTMNGQQLSHRIPCTSYEISAVLLALTAKHVPEKRTADADKRAVKIADKADRAWAQELVEALIARRGSGGGSGVRGWRYNQIYGGRVIEALPTGNEDMSSTQLAALALFAASRVGLDVPPDVWTDIAGYTLDQQEAKGPDHPRHVPPGSGTVTPVVDQARGWAYLRTSPDALENVTSGAMTACGVANLLMAREGLAASKRGKKAWDAAKLEPRATKAIDDGLAWLDKHWSAFTNPGHNPGYYDTYYLYALERAMDLLGRELLGGHAWYVEGAEELLRRTNPVKVPRLLDDKGGETDGVFWEVKNTHLPHDVLDTCFALLFLKRSTKSLSPVPATTGGG